MSSLSFCHRFLWMLRAYKGSKPNRTVHYRITHQALGTLVLYLWTWWWNVALGKHCHMLFCTLHPFLILCCRYLLLTTWSKRFFWTKIGILVLMCVPFPCQRLLIYRLLSLILSNLLLSCFSISLRAAAPVLLFLLSLSLAPGFPASLPSLAHQALLSCPSPFHSSLLAPRHWCFFTSPFLLSIPLRSLASISSQHVLFCFLLASAIQASLTCIRPSALHQLCHVSPIISFHISLGATWARQIERDPVILPGSKDIGLF